MRRDSRKDHKHTKSAEVLRHLAIFRNSGLYRTVRVFIRVAGHASITISQKYVHPIPEVLENAWARLEQYRKDGQNSRHSLQNPLQREVVLVQDARN